MMTDPPFTTQGVSFDANTIAEITATNQDRDYTSDSNESLPGPPDLQRASVTQNQSVLLESAGKVTANTSIFVPPSSSRYLTAPRNSYDTSTKCVIPKDSRPSKQSDLRKL